MALLEIQDLIVDYGIIRALKGINMKVEQGSIVAVLGANGAGKSTAIRSVSGAVKVKSGKIVLDGEEIQNLDPYKITARGLLQSPEGRLIFTGLTVEDNLLTGAYSLKPYKEVIKDSNGNETIKKHSVSKMIKESFEEIYEYFPVLKERSKQQASTLSGGEQQMLAIGRALMGRPKILLLDEPSLGLAPLIVKDIFKIIETIKNRGTTILIVEQNVFQTLKIADYAYLLELGKIKKEGKASDLLQDEELVNAYLGNKK